jgi:hypothetical protein
MQPTVAVQSRVSQDDDNRDKNIKLRLEMVNIKQHRRVSTYLLNKKMLFDAIFRPT